MKTHQDQSTKSRRESRRLWLLSCLSLCLTVCGALWPSAAAVQNAREVRVANTTAAPGSNVTVAIELIAQGNENALGFSLSFNNAILTNPQVAAGSAAPNVTPLVNSNQVANGRLGLVIALPAGQAFAAGTRQVATVTFAIPANAPSGATTIGFGDQPISRELSDPNANALTATFTPGSVTVQTQANPVPTLSSLNPNSATAGGPAFSLTVNGTAFVSSSIVRWNGNDRATTFVSSTQLRAAIPVSDSATAGTANVTVFTPAPGGGQTSALPFTIANALANVSAASFLGQELAQESIVAAFGTSLATSVAVASTTPLPTTLAGTTLKVRDSAGTERNAPLFFVAPAQINYQMPPGTAPGPATVTVTSGNGVISSGLVQMSSVAPGLFTANASGQGVAAAVALRVKANGEQVFEALARFDQATGVFVPAPLDLGPEGEQVFLIGFGTGLRGRSSLAAVSARLGGLSVEVLFVGAQGGFVGLDQLNLGPLPRNLAGRGNVDFVLMVDGKNANTTQLNIK